MSESHKGHWTGDKNPTKRADVRKKISDALKGQTAPIKGRKQINNGEVNKYVKPSELELFLNNGWQLGRIKKNI